MNLHVGLLIFSAEDCICVVNTRVRLLLKAVLDVATDIHGWLVNKQIDRTAVRGVCLEAGAMSSFVYKGLEVAGLPARLRRILPGSSVS